MIRAAVLYFAKPSNQPKLKLLAEALAKGTPNRSKIALTVLEDKIKEMV